MEKSLRTLKHAVLERISKMYETYYYDPCTTPLPPFIPKDVATFAETIDDARETCISLRLRALLLRGNERIDISDTGHLRYSLQSNMGLKP